MYRLSHPSGTTHAQYHKYWECNSCNHRYNPVDIASCLICDKERTRHRYSAVVNGSIYLCRLLKNNATLTVLNVFNDDHFETDLMKSEGTIDESIVEAIGRHLDEVCSVTALSTTDKKKSALQITSPSPSPTKLSSLLGSSLSLLLNPGLSLFDQVISNAESVVYSSKIGQYVSKDTVTVDSDTGVTTLDSSPMKVAFSYVSAMNKERHVMSDVVSEVVRRRKEAYLYDSTADLDVNRNEWESFQICQLCERSYPKSQLYGLISMKAVINWKIEHNVQFAPNDHRLDITNIHSGAKLCIFCTQFFDTKYCDLFDPQQMKLSVGISNIPGPLNCSNTVYKKMLRTSVKKWQLLGQARPLSRMRHKLELEQLKLKATQSEINKNARFQYNPKQPDHLVDQEVVGNYLRRKYVESKDGGLSALPKKKKNKKIIRKLAPIAISAPPLDSTAGHVPDHSVKADQLSTKARRKPHELLNTKSDAIISIHTAPAVKQADALVITSSHTDKHTSLVSLNNSASVPTSNSSSSDANISKHASRTRKRLTLQIKGSSGDATTGDRDDRGVIEIELCSDSIKTTLPKLKLHSLLDNIKLHRGIHDIPVQRPIEEVDSIRQQPQCNKNDIGSVKNHSKIVERDCYYKDDLTEDCYYEDDFIADEVTPTDETEGDCNKMGNEDNNSDIIDGDGSKDSKKDSALSSDDYLRVVADDSPIPIDNNSEQRKGKHVTVPPLFIPEEINYESDLPDEEGDGQGQGQQATIPQTEEEGEDGEYVDDFTEDGDDLFDEGDDYYYDDDEFLSDGDGGDVEQEKSWGLVESMDEYNWVTGGSFVPPTGGIDTATIIIDGSKSKSPIKSPLLVYEASLPFKTADRIELLSRASSSGFSFRPNSTDNPSRESRHRKYMGSGRISTTGDQLSPFGNHNILVNAWEISSPTRYVDSSIADKLPNEIQEGQSADGDQKDQSVKGVAVRRTTNTNRKVFEKTKKLKSKYSTGLKPTWKS